MNALYMLFNSFFGMCIVGKSPSGPEMVLVLRCGVNGSFTENSCARTDAIFTPYPGYKSHVKGKTPQVIFLMCFLYWCYADHNTETRKTFLELQVKVQTVVVINWPFSDPSGEYIWAPNARRAL